MECTINDGLVFCNLHVYNLVGIFFISLYLARSVIIEYITVVN